ncbi:hypothetical protein D3C86_1868630 [compost metagenome]
MGTVTKRSTSSGERPVASVAICTWTLVTSGNASTESLPAARRPKKNSTTAITHTTSRCLIAASTRDVIMAAYPCSRRLRSLSRWNAPSTTTRSPGLMPPCTTRMPSLSAPSLTLVMRYWPGEVST